MSAEIVMLRNPVKEPKMIVEAYRERWNAKKVTLTIECDDGQILTWESREDAKDAKEEKV